MKQRFYCRWASSLGELEATAEEVWGTPPYEYNKHKYENLVLFGMYDLRDYYTLWRHRGKAWVLWAGSDIRNLRANFLFNDGKLVWLSRLFPPNRFKKFLIEKVLQKAEHWVENEVEMKQLKDMRVKIDGVCPSFLGDISKFKISYKYSHCPKVYTSVSGDKFDLYNWHLIDKLAIKFPLYKFHLYGNLKPWKTNKKNIIIHGRVPKEQMNQEIKDMQGALRLVKFEGFSEIVAKSVLMGQWPVSPFIDYPFMLKDLAELKYQKQPNIKGRDYYREVLNQYPWNQHV